MNGRERAGAEAALLAIFIVLEALYESCIHPLTIMSTLPSAGIGGLLAGCTTISRSSP